MRYTRTLAAATTALAVAGLAACGGSGSTTKSASSAGGNAGTSMVSVADAMSNTTKATSQYTSVKMKLAEKVVAAGQNMAITGSGAVSWKPVAMDMTMTMPQLAQLGGDGSIRMMMTGTTMYMNMGDAAAAKLGGKHWMKMDLSKAAGGAGLSGLNSGTGNDPSTQLALFTSSGDVKRVGTETVDGVQTTHYAGTVDLAKLAGSDNAQLKSLIGQSSKIGLSSLNLDLWVDAQNLPVKVHETSPASSSVQFDVTADYTDYGTAPVTVTPPPASDTNDLSGMLPSGTGTS